MDLSAFTCEYATCSGANREETTQVCAVPYDLEPPSLKRRLLKQNNGSLLIFLRSSKSGGSFRLYIQTFKSPPTSWSWGEKGKVVPSKWVIATLQPQVLGLNEGISLNIPKGNSLISTWDVLSLIARATRILLFRLHSGTRHCRPRTPAESPVGSGHSLVKHLRARAFLIPESRMAKDSVHPS